MKRHPSMCQKLEVRELIFVLQHARVSSRSTERITTTRAATAALAPVDVNQINAAIESLH